MADQVTNFRVWSVCVCVCDIYLATCLQASEVLVMSDKMAVFNWFFARSTSNSVTLVHRRILRHHHHHHHHHHQHHHNMSSEIMLELH